MPSLFHTIVGVFPETKDQEIPSPYRQPETVMAPVVDGSPSEPSEGDSPITEQPEQPI